jgi:hypothetical protein
MFGDVWLTLKGRLYGPCNLRVGPGTQGPAWPVTLPILHFRLCLHMVRPDEQVADLMLLAHGVTMHMALG